MSTFRENRPYIGVCVCVCVCLCVCVYVCVCVWLCFFIATTEVHLRDYWDTLYCLETFLVSPVVLLHI